MVEFSKNHVPTEILEKKKLKKFKKKSMEEIKKNSELFEDIPVPVKIP